MSKNKAKHQKNRRLLTVILMALSVNTFGETNRYQDDTQPSLQIGAAVYVKRCELCHGNQGMGEGVLALKLKDYPDTNLIKHKHVKTKDDIKKLVVYGGQLDNVSNYMPPFGQELTWTELESVTLFLEYLSSNNKAAHTLLTSVASEKKQDVKVGQQVFTTRCVLCHGPYGEGNGRMAKMLKNPPPADLTASRMPDAYLEKIISLGGKEMGRSEHMPPWRDQLSEDEIKSVVMFIKTLRD